MASSPRRLRSKAPPLSRLSVRPQSPLTGLNPAAPDDSDSASAPPEKVYNTRRGNQLHPAAVVGLQKRTRTEISQGAEEKRREKRARTDARDAKARGIQHLEDLGIEQLAALLDKKKREQEEEDEEEDARLHEVESNT
ncbi:hypothetical protein BV25DRAFT_1821972 [Artomyces pyxidatus]|uniref:Uncharacterized protein n=1 Tax=Artomyces pyxidatus TaxID=48021 RepID=A0ACB8TBK0_9AGAM|nr:hypothetical protein BV25DRAFT_1821972 [Artomyces pyxidatus]